MTKEKAIFIGATEVDRRSAVGGGSPEQNPAIFCIDAPIMRSFVELHGLTPPPKAIDDYFSNGPIIWDSDMGKLTFGCWYWRCVAREWMFARFHSLLGNAEPFFDGSESYCLAGVSYLDSSVLAIESIPLSLGAMSKLVKEVKVKKQFVMAAAKGVIAFSDFAAFEYQYLNSLGNAPKVLPKPAGLPSKRRSWH